MLWMGKKRYVRRFAVSVIKVFGVLFITIFMVAPLIFKYSYKLQQHVVFPAFVNMIVNPNYSNPSKYGLHGARNIYIESDENVRLGVWHILPENLSHITIHDNKYFDEALNNGNHIIIYSHGNSASRAAPYRVALYKILRKYFHVLAFDYRGYADSSNIPPTENGVVRDCMSLYEWVANRTSSKIFVWGHSLGTAITTHALSILSTKDIKPYGLILESPFTNMREEIREYPLSRIFRFLPWFQFTIIEPMQQNNFIFATDKHILNVDCPILILHAEDDLIVPFELGYKLYEEAFKYRKPDQGTVEFIGFSRTLGYGHKKIFRVPQLPRIVEKFIRRAIEEMDTKNLLH